MHKFVLVVTALLLIGVILTSGCAKEAVIESEGIVDILAISPDCATDSASIDNCCKEQCVSFCEENGLPYAKHTPNVKTCGCWCG